MSDKGCGMIFGLFGLTWCSLLHPNGFVRHKHISDIYWAGRWKFIAGWEGLVYVGPSMEGLGNQPLASEPVFEIPLLQRSWTFYPSPGYKMQCPPPGAPCDVIITRNLPELWSFSSLFLKGRVCFHLKITVPFSNTPSVKLS